MVSEARTTNTTDTADVAVIGDGLIGLSTAFALGRAGFQCVIFGTTRPGAASTAAAGLLVPSVGHLPDDVRPFFFDSLDRYPSFIDSLREYEESLVLVQGLVERSDAGELIHPRDGAIDNVKLVGALRRVVAACPTIQSVADDVVALELDDSKTCIVLRSGGRVMARRVILAAGAWSPEIQGLPRTVPVRPLKGQMIALGASVIERPVMGDDVYLVPRGNETLVGATVEEAGFDLTVTNEAVRSLRAGAVALFPSLETAPVTRSWAGIRPATPDMLPILGPDPDFPGLLYACGHSKNGILLAPGTAAALVALCKGERPPAALDRFSIKRLKP